MAEKGIIRLDGAEIVINLAHLGRYLSCPIHVNYFCAMDALISLHSLAGFWSLLYILNLKSYTWLLYGGPLKSKEEMF